MKSHESYSGEIPRPEQDFKASDSTSKNHYEMFGIPENASEAEIKKAWIKFLRTELHEDQIIAMKDGPEKDAAEAKFEAAKNAYDVLTNHKKKYAYDEQLRVSGAGSKKVNNEHKVNMGAEKAKEWLELAKVKLELARDKAQMMAIVEEYNKNFPVKMDISHARIFLREMIVSVPEGDFAIIRNQSIDARSSEMYPMELTPYKIGDPVKVSRSSGGIEAGWSVMEFKIVDTANGPERYIVVGKVEDEQTIKKTYPAKMLREINMN